MSKYQAPRQRDAAGPAAANRRVELRALIVEACAARGDTDEHRAALMRDMRDEPVESYPFWIGYFRGEANRYKFDRARFEEAAK